MTQIKTKIPAELEPAAVGGMVTDAKYIKDREKNKTQKDVNAEFEGRVSTLEESVGTGGSVDERISQAKSEVIGDAGSDYNTLGKLEDKLQEEVANRASQNYTKAETYSKTELNNMITTPNQKYETYTATDQTTAVTDVLPATGEADTIYRVGKWDGSQYDTTCYTEYAWNGSVYVLLNTKEYGIDDEPTVNSQNLVKSGGVYEKTSQLDQEIGEFDYDYTKEATGYINADGSVTSSSAFGITNDIQLYAGDTIRAKTGSQGFAIIAKHSSGTNPYEQIKAAVINQWVEYTAPEDTIVVCCGLVNNANPSLDLAIKIKRVQSIENQIELLNNDVNLRLKTENSVSLAIQGKGNDNSTYLSLKLIEGQKYSLVFDKTTWNTTSITGNNVVFALDRISDGASSNIFVVRGSSPTVKKEYIFVADTNDYYKFLVKSDIGETVFFSVINITDTERTNNVFEGNNISFVGDSITTFNGYNGSNPYYYPTGDVLSVEDTWWRKMLRKTNGNLKENLSASGGSVCRISQRTSLIDNVSLLQNTDVLLLAGGVNDSIVGATLGYCDFTKSTSDLDETKFSEAYDKYVRIAQTKANKVLIIITSKIGNDYRDIIIKIAEHYGIQYIDLTKISSIIGTISNSVHPNKSGMEFMSDYVTDELYSNFSPIREIVEVLKNNLFLIEWNNGTLNSTTGAIEPVASAAYSSLFLKGTKLKITLKRGYAYGIYKYQDDGTTFITREYYYNVGYDRVIYYTVTDGTARILFDGLGTTVDARTIGNYIKVEVLSDYVLPEKLNANTILNRRTVVSDAFSYLCGDASFLLADGNTGIAYVGYSTSKTGYGEQKSIIALSVFPLCQPFRAEHYEVMKVGETYGSYTFSNFRDINFIEVGNVIRCFFSGYIGESLDVTWYYMDFDKTTHNVSNLQVVKFKKPGNATLFDLSKTNWQAFLTEESVEFNSDSSPAPNANFVYHDNKLYTVICTLSDIGKCCGHNAVAYTTDNGETFQVTGIVPYGCEYEAQITFDEDGKMYMVQRGNAGSDMNYKPLVTSDDDGQTFSGMNFFTIGSTRPQMLNYKGNILLCTPLENWMDSDYAKNDWRAGFVMRIGTGTDTKDYKEVLRLYSKEGLLYYSIMNYKGVLYAAIIEGGLFPDKSGNRKDKVSFCKIGEIDASGNLILD